jgi:leader peptidase (prepilin peptidase)/N-methyltransferase
MIPGDVPQWIVLPWLFAFGAVIGSFLNVCIYRIPGHEYLWDQLRGLTHPPSSCPFCRKRILAIDNIPVFGWLVLRGRCRFCRHWIPPRYALIEFFNGLLWVLLYIAIVPAGFSAKISESCLWSPLGPLANPALRHDQIVFQLHAMYFYYLVLAEALLVSTFIDFDLQIIPDGSTIPALVVGVLASFAIGDLHLWPVWFQNPPQLQLLFQAMPHWAHWLFTGPVRLTWLAAHPHLHGLLSSIAGIVIGGGVIWILRIIGKWAWKREVMGFGDVILMMMIGSFLGWQPTVLVFVVAPFCGLIATGISLQFFKTREIAYGPYLSVGAIIVLLTWRVYFSGPYFQDMFGLGPLIPVVGLIMIVLTAVSLVLVRRIRQLLGFRDFDFEDLGEEWTSGDQLAFYANKNDDTNPRSDLNRTESGRSGLQVPNWPGHAAAQGRQFADRWHSGGK